MARRVRRGRRRGGAGKILFVLFLLLIAGAAAFVYLSPKFERVPPQIQAPKMLAANGSTPFRFTVIDNQNIKSVKVVLSSGGKEVPIYSQNFMLPSRKQTIEVKLPPEILKSKIDKWNIAIIAKDSSLWKIFGNSAVYKGQLIIDNTPPQVNLVAASTYILQGGSGLVIFEARDSNLKTVYVDVGSAKFKPVKYKKDGVYATLFAWPFKQESFNLTIVAIDSANNITKYPVNLDKVHKKYRVSKIRATDKFINGKISDLARTVPEYASITDKVKKFRAVNELMRKANEDYIHSLSKAVTPFKGSWDIKPFKPLKGAKRVSDFGAKRFYYYNDPNNIISTSYHVGYDFASVKHDNIYSSNSGVVVSTKLNGIYGNMPLIDHGFGLYTLYGHCSTVLVSKGQKVTPGQLIAKTGTTGLALGDHLHFGILVQGVEVFPLEWMKKKWIKEHITDVFKKADKVLGVQ